MEKFRFQVITNIAVNYFKVNYIYTNIILSNNFFAWSLE